MGSVQKDSIVKIVLKNLCCSFGWSYGVFWSFDHPNSLLLTMQDAYYEEKIGALIDDLRLKVSILGEGIIGEAASTKKHQWISSENHYRADNSLGSIWDMFPDDSEFHCQFSSGIKTIAVIPVEPQGVVQFGSIEKILERTEFVNQTKQMFHEFVNGGGPEIVPCSSVNSQSCPQNGLFASLISSESSYFNGQNSVGPNSSSAYPPQSCSFSSKSQATMLNHNQFTTQSQPNNPLLHFPRDANFSFKEPIISESRALESWNSFSSQSNSHLTFTNMNQDLFDSLPDFGIPDEFFQTEDFNISQWFPPSPEQSNVEPGGPTQTVGLHPINSDEKAESLAVSGVDFDLLGNTKDWGGIVMPVVNERSLDVRSYDLNTMSVSTSAKNGVIDSTALGPKKGLFSKLGIEELLEGISGTSNASSTSCIEDQVSFAAKRRKTGNSTWEMSSLQPVVYGNNLEPKKEAVPKSLQSLWTSNAYSVNCSSMVSQAKKQIEPLKPIKKKAKPGTRPRPKDRQQILDRMAELRELIPNGQKMSIDCLLDRTIKHMLFLQSVTKHTDKIKLADERKNNLSSNGVTWACELGNQTMICPLIVEDLSTPGQMLIEMLCEEQGFFLEIVDILRGFGLTILKGVMEVRDKIWAQFIVEAEAKGHVKRHEIFSALVQLLQVTSPTDNELHNKVVENENPMLNGFQQSGVQFPISLAETQYSVNL